MSACVGIDVSKATLDVAVRCQGDTPHYLQVPNTAEGFDRLQQWLQAFDPITRIGLEASGRYGEAIAHFLVAQDYPVSYLNPRQIHAFSQFMFRYNKTDKQDAALIAHFCEHHLPDLWRPHPQHYRQLQQRGRYLKSLQQMRQAECNRLHAGPSDPFVRQQIQAHITYLDARIEQTQSAIDHLIQQHTVLRHDYQLLISIAGIGDRTATLLLAELGDVRRFDNARQLAAYIGITPQHFQSGSSVNKRATISKQGNARLRAALYMPAVVAKRWNKPCAIFAQRLQAAHKPGKVIVIAVMRKLVHQVYAILKSGRPFDPDFALAP